MEINFCPDCDNHLFIYSDEEKQKLYLGCKSCGKNIEYDENLSQQANDIYSQFLNLN